jgi:hypothetical protein
MENADDGFARLRNTCNFAKFMMTMIFQRIPEMVVARRG